ncbi:hypothetical protein [Staphylococcus sp. 11261D007BR]
MIAIQFALSFVIENKVYVIGIVVSYIYFYAYPMFTLYNGYNKWIFIVLSIVLTLLFLWIGYKILQKHMEKGQL